MSDFKNDPIEVRITDDNKIIVSETIISDSVKYERIKFSFHDGWDDYTKTAVFRHYDKTLNIILNGDSDLCTEVDECYIPHEVIKAPEFTVSVFGILGDSRITTPQASIRVIKSGYADGDTPDKPTKTEYEQLINLSEETRNIAQSVRDDADSGVFKGDKGDQGIPGPKGDDAVTDQTYNPESKNAQSGKAVAQALYTVKTDLNQKEVTANKVFSVSSVSTDSEYPSAKAVFDYVNTALADLPESEESAY